MRGRYFLHLRPGFFLPVGNDTALAMGVLMTCQGNVLRDQSSEDDRQPPHDEAGHGADSGKSGGRPRVWPCRTAETGGRGALRPASGHTTKETKIAEFRSRGRSRTGRKRTALGREETNSKRSECEAAVPTAAPRTRKAEGRRRTDADASGRGALGTQARHRKGPSHGANEPCPSQCGTPGICASRAPGTET